MTPENEGAVVEFDGPKIATRKGLKLEEVRIVNVNGIDFLLKQISESYLRL